MSMHDRFTYGQGSFHLLPSFFIILLILDFETSIVCYNKIMQKTKTASTREGCRLVFETDDSIALSLFLCTLPLKLCVQTCTSVFGSIHRDRLFTSQASIGLGRQYLAPLLEAFLSHTVGLYFYLLS